MTMTAPFRSHESQQTQGNNPIAFISPQDGLPQLVGSTPHPGKLPDAFHSARPHLLVRRRLASIDGTHHAAGRSSS